MFSCHLGAMETLGESAFVVTLGIGETYVAGYQHLYLSECKRQLDIHPSSAPYLMVTMLSRLFAMLNLAMLFGRAIFISSGFSSITYPSGN